MAARAVAERPEATNDWARLVPAAPPSEIITSPPAAWNSPIEALIALAWSTSASGARAASPAQAGSPFGAACMKPSVSREVPRDRAISERSGTGQRPMST